MLLQFKQALLIDRKRYGLGVHEVPEVAMNHVHFKKFIKAGYIVVAGSDPAKRDFKDLPVLPPPKSAAAGRSSAQAKAIIEKEEAASGEDVASEKQQSGKKKGK